MLNSIVRFQLRWAFDAPPLHISAPTITSKENNLIEDLYRSYRSSTWMFLQLNPAEKRYFEISKNSKLQKLNNKLEIKYSASTSANLSYLFMVALQQICGIFQYLFCVQSENNSIEIHDFVSNTFSCHFQYCKLLEKLYLAEFNSHHYLKVLAKMFKLFYKI
jgi:hypothetical protein